MIWQKLGLALLSGLLLFLSFPKFGSGIFAWIALVPLLRSLKGISPNAALAQGFTAGIVYNIGIVYWVTYVIANYGDLPFYASVLAMVLLASALSCYVALFAAGTAWMKKRGIPEFLSAPVLWTGIEFAKGYLFTGFPWENLAYSQHAFPLFIQITDITGTYGLSFLIVLVNAAVLDLLFSGATRRRVLAQTAVAVLLVAGTAVYGYIRQGEIDRIAAAGEERTVALIQGNIDQSIKWNPEFQEETLEIYRELSLAAIRTNPSPELIVWPETATPFFFQNEDQRQRRITDISIVGKSHLLLGSPSFRREGGMENCQNSAFMVSPDGRITGRYDKVHLVPFGEYVPLRESCPILTKIVAGVGDFLPGSGFNPLQMGPLRAGVLICYEAVFPDIGAAYARAGAQFFINITNDAWFGRTSAPYQHLTMAAFRAVENRRYLVRAANTGISAVIGPTGAIESASGLFERTVLKGRFRAMSVKTFYTEYGDVFAYACLAFIFVLGIRAIFFRKGRKYV
ncbi:MAG: apolipoprotein N-acyltransferase [Syntrophales bacterium]|nr:apolipoprotein N-acyltransferase [Syntrophales bacterium]MDD5532093.1 apolipoprotein N-acyltransferase [Syntrophales bacterium]